MPPATVARVSQTATSVAVDLAVVGALGDVAVDLDVVDAGASAARGG